MEDRLRHIFRKKRKNSSRPLSQLKAENQEKLKQSFRRREDELSAYPAVLYIEATSTCNLRCPMCPITMDIPEYRYPVKHFQLDLLEKLKAPLRHARRCFLSGGGEPLLHPSLFEIIRAVKDAGPEVIFNSNGTLLGEKEALRFIEAGVECISFSIDGATRGTYEAIRVPAKFEPTVANIQRLARMKEEANSALPYINIQFTVIDANHREIPELIPLARSLGANQVVVEPLTPVFNFDPGYRAYYEAHAVPADAVLEGLKHAEEQAGNSGLIFSSHYLYREEHPEKTEFCGQPWITFGVRVDGRVFTCCGTPERMGHLAESEFHDIWNGEAYRRLRKALARGEFPEFCDLCIEENRSSHFNEDILLD
jgi:MoaA/NifB/PqqE/SkfB family radical SAM enzyme